MSTVSIEYLKGSIQRIRRTILDVDAQLLQDAIVLHGPNSPQAQQRRRQLESDQLEFTTLGEAGL